MIQGCHKGKEHYNSVTSLRPFYEVSIFLEAEEKKKGVEKSANGDNMALIEITAVDRDEIGYINPVAFPLRQYHDNFEYP